MATEPFNVNPGYVFGQLSRALRAGDPSRVAKWQAVIDGLNDGSLEVGSRTPVAGVPAWVTLEVVKGGFATGQFAAQLPTQPTNLNRHFLTEAGQTHLLHLLDTGCYRINVPEEGALLTVAWLAAHGQLDRAYQVLEAITPFFDRLRFYPVPDARPLITSAMVFRQSVAKTATALRSNRRQLQVEIANEAILYWLPIYDRVVSLFLETIPAAEASADWRAKASALLAEYRSLRTNHHLSPKPDNQRSNFCRLRTALETCVSGRLTPGQISAVRKMVDAFVARYGVPGSDLHQALRAQQRAMAERPLHVDLRKVVVERLAEMAPDDGLGSVEAVGGPVTEGESVKFRVAAGASMPDSVRRKLERSLVAPIETLVEKRVIPSGEVLAQVVPQITAQVRAAGLDDAALRRLSAAIYGAFRKRRSLLLTGYASQVKLSELPWVQAIEANRAPSLGAEVEARQVFTQLASVTFTAFPQTIVPNKLLTEFRALAQQAVIDLPFVDELAADIFMGGFSGKFLKAAQIAAKVLDGSLYERYYGYSAAEVLRIDDVVKTPNGPGHSEKFNRLCRELAGPGALGSVAGNGKVIEQGQVLTTQNLAPVFEALGLGAMLRERLPELAQRCFAWVCRQQAVKSGGFRSVLRRLKNCAYAWRQMIFYLSLAEAAEVNAFLPFVEDYLAKQLAQVQTRLRPAVEGLRLVVRGGRFESAPRGEPVQQQAGSAKRFLGWTTERHWLLGPDPRKE